jgi:hypothetical protein
VTHNQLLNFPPDPILDLDPWVGQRQASFRFDRINGLTGDILGELHPIRDADLTHDTTRIIKRQLTMSLGIEDTATINVVTDRILLYMTFPDGTEYPLGRYMFTDASRQVFSAAGMGEHTAGGIADVTLNDEMFLVDQQITTGVDAAGLAVEGVIVKVLEDLDVSLVAETSPYNSFETWGIGQSRGAILEALSVTGDYFSPWFGNDGKLHFIRSFDPATAIPDFNYDTSRQVIRDAILETDDLITAPNRFVVISNAGPNLDEQVVGTADVPESAPHSIANRGFVVASVLDLQLTNTSQATAVAQGLALRQTVFERVGLTTALDPRHDSYNVIRWQGENWLELAWSMPLTAGGAMSHLLRKAYG